MNDKNTYGVQSCGLFLHENHVTSQGHAAYCNSLAGISVFLGCLKIINKRTIALKEYEKTTMCF